MESYSELGMKAAGWLLLVGGLVTAFIALMLDTSIPSYGTLGIDRVTNISKVQTQTLTFGCGAVLFLAGSIFLGFGAVLDKMSALSAKGESE